MITGLVLSILAAREVRATGSLPFSLWPTVMVLAGLAVAVGPISSHDLWSYSSYGRMISAHGVNPYDTVPSAFPHDVVYPLVGWRETPSGYGPLFTAFSATLTAVAGHSLLLMRLGFQTLAAGAVVFCLWICARARRSAALTLVALQPFVWISVVNGGHIDAIVAAVLLAAVVCFDRDQIGRSAAFTAIAVLLKLTAVFVVVPFLVLLAFQRRWRDASLMAAATTATLLASYILAPGSISNASSATRGIITRVAVWRPFQLMTQSTGATVTTLATATVLCGIAWVSWQHRRDFTSDRGAGSALSVFGMISSYTYPWYLFLGLPMLALSGDLLLVGIVAARATLMAASYQFDGTANALRMVNTASMILAVLLSAAFLWRAGSRRRSESPIGTAGPDGDAHVVMEARAS